MTETNQNYERLKAYANDLDQRLKQEADWKQRHPDHNTEEYETDWENWENDPEGQHTYKSTFDPNDPCVSTSDVLSAQRFNDLIQVAIQAYEQNNRT